MKSKLNIVLNGDLRCCAELLAWTPSCRPSWDRSSSCLWHLSKQRPASEADDDMLPFVGILRQQPAVVL
jgi:hypothetical protein